ncbi:MAG: hypothetical protein R3E57_03105 [Porticoccaceae bacterium]
MTYLLIALVLAIIVSPLLWFRQTPRQKLITAMRQQASRGGLQVRLVRPPDAREGEGRLEFVCYTMPWQAKTEPSVLPRAEQWLLVKDTRRGDPSPWQGWQWLGRDPSEQLHAAIGQAVVELPSSASGLEASASGLSVYWQERGELTDVERIVSQLTRLRGAIRPSTNVVV